MNDPSPLDSLADTPEWLPHLLDPANDQVTLLRMGEEDYRQASFLDQRAIKPGAEIRQIDWSRLTSLMPERARRDAQYIFHIGNVGSTLVSRLLGELDAVLALREPLLLRTFAEMAERWPTGEMEVRLDILTALLSRTFRAEQCAIVKATSFTSEIAARLVPPGLHALFLYVTPQHYLENILAGENSRQTLQILGPMRLARLRRRCEGLEVDLGRLPDAHKAALAWACEMTSLRANAAQLPADSVMWLDFDLFLGDPVAHFGAIARHFGLAVDPATARNIAEGPLMHRYSKALEYDYSPALRREILAEARAMHGPAIRDALVWLNGLASRYPAVAQAIRQAQRGR